MKDALTLGVELKEKEAAARERRIANAIAHGKMGDYNGARNERVFIASQLYQARYDGRAYWEQPDAQEILDTFCWSIFGASFEEVLTAWDKELG